MRKEYTLLAPTLPLLLLFPLTLAFRKTFGLAYSFDALVAIAAGALASSAATLRGVTGPFELAAVVLAISSVGIAVVWSENKVKTDSERPALGIRDGIETIKKVRACAEKKAMSERKGRSEPVSPCSERTISVFRAGHFVDSLANSSFRAGHRAQLAR